MVNFKIEYTCKGYKNKTKNCLSKYRTYGRKTGNSLKAVSTNNIHNVKVRMCKIKYFKISLDVIKKHFFLFIVNTQYKNCLKFLVH